MKIPRRVRLFLEDAASISWGTAKFVLGVSVFFMVAVCIVVIILAYVSVRELIRLPGRLGELVTQMGRQYSCIQGLMA